MKLMRYKAHMGEMRGTYKVLHGEPWCRLEGITMHLKETGCEDVTQYMVQLQVPVNIKGAEFLY
jgi:hypothetical protein